MIQPAQRAIARNVSPLRRRTAQDNDRSAAIEDSAHIRHASHAGGATTLCVDVGGTHIKASVLDAKGNVLHEAVRADTPHPCPPPALVGIVGQLARQLPAFDRVSVGFPGVVRDRGRILTAANLGQKAWQGFRLDTALQERLSRPVRVGNDADVAGMAAIQGKGVEVVVTLGTGFGTAIFEDGKLGPHLEIAHVPFRKGDTFEEQLGAPALEEVGKKKWNKRVGLAIETLRTLTQFDHLYIGGGNAKKLTMKLPTDVGRVPNSYGMAGGLHLWDDVAPARSPSKS